jgi:tripartite-type tricarboxylate transporter receptor subunit TctC
MRFQTIGRGLVRGLMVAALVAAAGGAAAQSSQAFPNRPITIVVPFPPGGSSDMAARVMGERMAREWGQPILVDNRTGAGTTIAATRVARSAPDGYTLYLVGPGTHGVSAALYKDLPYDAIKSFAGVSLISSAPFIFVVPADSPIKSMGDLIAAARAAPGKVTYSTSGTGAGPHLIAERVAMSQQIQLVHVPFRGAAPATLAAVAGQVQFSLTDTSAVPYIRSGKLRALAVTSGERSKLFPDLPTLAEVGVPDIVYPLSVGILAPAGVPQETLQEINRVMRIALNDPAVRERLEGIGFELKATSPKEFDELVAFEVRRYQDIVKAIGLKLE